MKKFVLVFAMLLYSFFSISQTVKFETKGIFCFGFNIGKDDSNKKPEETINAKYSKDEIVEAGAFVGLSVSQKFLFSPEPTLSFNQNINNSSFELYPFNLYFIYTIGNSNFDSNLLINSDLNSKKEKTTFANFRFYDFN